MNNVWKLSLGTPDPLSSLLLSELGRVFDRAESVPRGNYVVPR